MAYKTVFLKRLGQPSLNGHELVKIALDLSCLRTHQQMMGLFLDIATQHYPGAERLFIVIPTQDKIYYMSKDTGNWEYQETGSLDDAFNITDRSVMLVDAPKPSLTIRRTKRVRR